MENNRDGSSEEDRNLEKKRKMKRREFLTDLAISTVGSFGLIKYAEQKERQEKDRDSYRRQQELKRSMVKEKLSWLERIIAEDIPKLEKNLEEAKAQKNKENIDENISRLKNKVLKLKEVILDWDDFISKLRIKSYNLRNTQTDQKAQDYCNEIEQLSVKCDKL